MFSLVLITLVSEKKKMFKPFQKKLFLSESKYQFFGGFMEKECSIILKNFFFSLRKNTI